MCHYVDQKYIFGLNLVEIGSVVLGARAGYRHTDIFSIFKMDISTENSKLIILQSLYTCLIILKYM